MRLFCLVASQHATPLHARSLLSMLVSVAHSFIPGLRSYGSFAVVQGNYSQYVAAKSEREALQWTAYEKQQKEIDKLQDMVRRLSGALFQKGGVYKSHIIQILLQVL
jgi:ATPase subunit of ABC transporter with duplicated ATPase domains